MEVSYSNSITEYSEWLQEKRDFFLDKLSKSLI
jgi:hypothetical protein